MCSISGAIKRGNIPINREFLKEIIVNAEDRGRDSFGISYFVKNNKIEEKYIGKSSLQLKTLLNSDSNIILNNNRAEPTTEFVDNKTLDDVQPFSGEYITVVHNGTISNDKELEKEYNLTRKTKIDSSIIPLLLEKIWDGTAEKLISILINDLIGSYSLAIVNKYDTNILWLATNYKPLFLIQDCNTNVLYFSSLENYFGFSDINKYLTSNFKIIQVKPYTLLKISNLKIEEYSLYKKDYEQSKKKKALVICSSGLDSTVCASWAKDKGYDISLLHFKYGCRAQKAEEKAINNIKNFFDCDLITIPIDFFKNTIKNSRLTNSSEFGDLIKENGGEKSAELAWEWVPARNLIFMSIAAAYAEAWKFDYIILGGNLEESGSYADNELIFQKKMNDILPNALNLQNKVEVLTPIANLMKHEIVKLGIELKAPLHLTWSCYEDGEIPCGTCGPDYMRKIAFKMNGYKDMQKYKIDDSLFWKNCKEIRIEN